MESRRYTNTNTTTTTNDTDDTNNDTDIVGGPAYEFEQHYILPTLQRRQQEGTLRTLIPYFPSSREDEGGSSTLTTAPSPTTTTKSSFIDFSSNDYLGLAQSWSQHNKVETAYHNYHHSQKQSYASSPPTSPKLIGSTGSRLLTGDTTYAHQLETKLANYHNQTAALLCNSGYDANLTVVQCVGYHASCIIMDELCHNSLHMGVRSISRTTTTTTTKSTTTSTNSHSTMVHQFRHNDINDLERILLLNQQQQQQRQRQKSSSSSSSSSSTLIVIESVYSMDGDIAPIETILDLALRYNACVIVDEAHGLGVYGSNDNTGGGMGVIQQYSLENHPALLCCIYTFGKAAGCHGAVITCRSQSFKTYLFNYGRPIMYSTSLPFHSLVCICCAYDTMRSLEGTQLRHQVHTLVDFFRRLVEKMLKEIFYSRNDDDKNNNKINNNNTIGLVQSTSPIQALIIPGNQRCVEFCHLLWIQSQHRIRLYPIRSPTVPKGQERVRIIIHAHNTKDEIRYLVDLIQQCLCLLLELDRPRESHKIVRSKL